ncbi:hypothetical protein GDO86_007929 [Hymenochirus boettgeri]|uniref:C3H1-type domain-containing protein n=1 Tax=Hymenochirus boettgeri TaxID=247094 RepID=A0A8T2J145_9PIPI|nr:hypothetical protein GDO86_007929 [Hymenochirus boettgeri]
MFPAGIYDTKYASEFEIRLTASYLEYAYKKCKRENRKLIDSRKNHMSIEFCSYPASMSSFVEYRYCSLPDPNQFSSKDHHICERFSAYGWCPNGPKCTQSHNIDLIIAEDEKSWEDKKKKRHKRKRQKNIEIKQSSEDVNMEGTEDSIVSKMEPPSKQHCVTSPAVTSINQEDLKEEHSNTAKFRMEEDLQANSPGHNKNEVISQSENSTKNIVKDQSVDADEGTKGVAGPAKEDLSKSSEGGTHRAGFDAFMTGYIMGYALLIKKEGNEHTSPINCLPDCHNKVYLSGKNVPLQIVKSVFSKSSRAHAQKIKLISDSSP